MSSSVPLWHAFVPVKRLNHAKSRLQLDASVRAELTLAMAMDTVEAVQSSPLVIKTWVVTADLRVRDHLCEGEIEVLSESVDGSGPAGDLNSALRSAIDQVRSTAADLSVAVFVADLPSLRDSEVTSALEQAEGRHGCFVPDSRGVGTTALITRDSWSFEPAFGTDSRAHHEAIGLIPLTAQRGLSHDVDTIDDLAIAQRYGVGRHTAEVISRRLV